MRWKKQLLSLSPYQPGKTIASVKQQFGLEKIVKLASNENPFGCSKKAAEEIHLGKSHPELYPDGNASELRAAVAEKFGVDKGQFIFGNGSDEIIQIISRALLYPGANTVMASPTFPQYRHNAILEGAEVREIPLDDGMHDLAGMLDAIDENTNVVWLCSPNNPTGTYIPEEELISFLEKVPSETLIAIDEAYSEYAVADNYHDTVSLIERFPNVIALRTFSKIYGLAALRVGFGIGNPSVIKVLEPAREPFNNNSFAQLAAKAAVCDQEFVEFCRVENRKGMEQFYQFCEEWKLDYYPSQGNFILIDFRQDANHVFEHMLRRGYIIRSGVSLGFPTSVRITIGSAIQCSELIAELEEFLKTESGKTSEIGERI